MAAIKQQGAIKKKHENKYAKDFRKNWSLYLMVLPVILYFVLFKYRPMYGILMAFQDFSPRKGIMGSEWVGLENVISFISNPYFGRVVRNTLTISFSTLLFGFPMPIIFALLVNELKGKWYPRAVQTFTYLPHFISMVVVCSLVKEFTAQNGLINDFLSIFGVQRKTMLNDPNLFVPIYVISNIWSTIGWGSIVYLAALTGIDQQLYEAAKIDGANRWKQTLHVTIPSIIPTIVVMLILRVGNLMNVGYEKIILLYNQAIYETSDVISSFVYRKGILQQSYSYSTAVGLFNSIINCVLLFSTNWLSKKMNDTGLW